jgi:HD domain
VPAGFWNTASPWTTQEWERAKQHPSLTELVLARSTALGHLGTLAGLHHERLDGSGYRGMPGSFLPLAAQILAAADTYHTKTEPRPHRRALAPAAAAEEIHRLAQRGQLDGQVTQALLVAAGHQAPPAMPDELPAGLSHREVEVLGLIVRGLSNRQMAQIPRCPLLGPTGQSSATTGRASIGSAHEREDDHGTTRRDRVARPPPAPSRRDRHLHEPVRGLQREDRGR